MKYMYLNEKEVMVIRKMLDEVDASGVELAPKVAEFIGAIRFKFDSERGDN